MFSFARVLYSRPIKITRLAANMPHFDVCVIGGGPAGIAAALRAVDYNKRVCLVEAKRMGGADLWNGALQSKTLWEMAKYVSRLSGQASHRVFEEDVVKGLKEKVNDVRIRETLEEVSKTRERQLLDGLKAAGVTLVYGKGIFSSPHELDVHSTNTGEYHVLTADYFIIATGSVPRNHEYLVTDGRRVVTTDTIMQLPIPSSLVIIGAGAAGCEFASIYANLGRTKVSLIDKAPRILPMEDEDIALFVQNQLERRGVTMHHNCTLFDLESWEKGEKGGCIYSVRRNDEGGAVHPVETHRAELALLSVGRVPNFYGLGLENTSCKVSDGVIVVDAFNRCVPHKHIYVIGDAAADRALVNLGEAQGRGAVDHMYSEKLARSINSSVLTNLTTVMFLEEEVACVGLNEQQCQQRNLSYMVARFDYEHLSRAIAMGETAGFCKVIVTNDREKRLLGVRAVGAHAGSIVEVASLAIRRMDSVYGLLQLTTSYPSVVQGFLECIRMILGRSSVKPNTTPRMTLNIWHPSHFERGRTYSDEMENEARSSKEWNTDNRQYELEMARMRHSVVEDVLRDRAAAAASAADNNNNNSK
ncbi:putative dihydrolipoamide dehydrogenase [Trypanosoma theileri]|uniref:Putative dihydrolipoamide dehydrogenase n=1 Tax=Trypanosoma theileri TaxID=67003 RepID=A0A1X0NK15_9TRYP|nr:putative dihydrolipoamide dehydrogenase [Trypanosoma theileri]ORC84519.1 putative dihydrolipoamide dehydrogenase [Trypanosoma theileri]